MLLCLVCLLPAVPVGCWVLAAAKPAKEAVPMMRVKARSLEVGADQGFEQQLQQQLQHSVP